MFAYYLRAGSPHSLDRALPLIHALAPSVIVLSNRARPSGWAGEWYETGSGPGGLTAPEEALAWLRENRPDAVVVDGDSEVARAAAAAGFEVAVVAPPGGGPYGELDPAYTSADLIIALWPERSSLWPEALRSRTVHLGLLSRRAATCLPSMAERERTLWRCLALTATGAGPGPRERRSMMMSTPGWVWSYASDRDLDEHGSLWQPMARADVVICAASYGVLAAVAATRAPAVVITPDRPTPEQAALASMVAELDAAVVLDSWPDPEEWLGLLEEARLHGGEGWREWTPLDGLGGLPGLMEELGQGSASVASVSSLEHA